jgi:hypothetical protein
MNFEAKEMLRSILTALCGRESAYRELRKEMPVLKRAKQKSRKLNMRQTGNASRALSYVRQVTCEPRFATTFREEQLSFRV